MKNNKISNGHKLMLIKHWLLINSKIERNIRKSLNQKKNKWLIYLFHNNNKRIDTNNIMILLN